MAIRASKDSVKAILGDQYDDVTDLQPFIVAANGLTDYVNSEDSRGLHSALTLETLEQWLAAFFYETADQMLQNKSTGKASGTFMGRTDMLFNGNYYGQRALLIDITGTLAELQQQAQNGKREVGMVWLGTRYTDDESERAGDQT